MPSSSCPGKIMLAGEYAVVEGGPALLVGVNARALAEISDRKQSLSPFLGAVQDVLSEHFGASSEQARSAGRVVVDTSAFQQQGQKLGLGSSAAATVAAVAACITPPGQEPDRDQVHSLAVRAHGKAQAELGARGSGADIAACTFGGCIRFQKADSGASIEPVQLPPELHLLFPWTGVSASTPPLVAAVRALGSREPEEYQKLCAAISASAEALTKAESAVAAVAAIEAGGQAVQALGAGAGVELWLPVHSQLAELAHAQEGALKPTGAGAGDLALAAFAEAGQADAFRHALEDIGIFCPALLVDNQGVRLQA
jgi:phosphomevalonate kinase